MIVPVLATLMAVAASAFTTKATTEELWYEDSDGSLKPFTGTPCPAGQRIQCQEFEPTEGRIVPVVTATGAPYMRS